MHHRSRNDRLPCECGLGEINCPESNLNRRVKKERKTEILRSIVYVVCSLFLVGFGLFIGYALMIFAR